MRIVYKYSGVWYSVNCRLNEESAGCASAPQQRGQHLRQMPPPCTGRNDTLGIAWSESFMFLPTVLPIMCNCARLLKLRIKFPCSSAPDGAYIDYRCEEREKVGKRRGDIRVIW
jgi:hypothetical protein